MQSQKKQFIEECKRQKLEHLEKYPNTFIQYLDNKGFRRNRTKPAVGVLIAYREDDGTIKFGWSKADKLDTFSKDVAFFKAKQRAKAVEDYFFLESNAPNSVRRVGWEFLQRVDRYWNRVLQDSAA